MTEEEDQDLGNEKNKTCLLFHAAGSVVGGAICCRKDYCGLQAKKVKKQKIRVYQKKKWLRKMNENGRQDDIAVRLFETKAAKGKPSYSLFVATVLVCTVSIWVYRLTHFPASGRLAWFGMFISELSFGVYWIFTLSPRFNVVHRFPFKDSLSLRYEKRLPDVDVFVCTADHTIEPPKMVIDTVLSAMSFNYPQEKLSVYLSDDGCSEFMFYALLEASEFARYWVPFCKEFKLEPRAPAAYFSQKVDLNDDVFANEWNSLKKLYEDMNSRIEKAIEQGYVSEKVKEKHKGFLEWRSRFPRNNHQSIVQIITDGGNQNSVDVAGHQLPTLVYVSREKRPHRPHNFKAGALNTLTRVSSEISNAPIILLLDCDMYSNDPDALRDSLCFLMDETQGQNIAFVQYPQRFHNFTKNDIYANVSKAITQIEMAGLDGCGTTLFSGTGCFHRRSSLYGHKYSKDNNMSEFSMNKNPLSNNTVGELENKSKFLANCEFEDETQWGKEMGMVYGLPVEDIVTGLAIQCRGWRSVYYNPSKYAFVGNAPTSLDISLVQYKRWFEGLFEVFASKYCPFIFGHGKIKLSAQMGYCTYLLCAPLSLPTLFYLIAPGLSLIHNIPLFPKVSSPWFVPFVYVFVARNAFNLYEALFGCGDTLKSWWNSQRMWMFRNTTSYVFAFIDLMKKVLGFSETTFVITAKVVDEDVQKQMRCENEMLEFGSSSVMFIMISTLALLNLVCFTWGIFNIIIHDVWYYPSSRFVELYGAQMVVSGSVVIINLPVYQALLLRRDSGRLPFSVLWKSIAAASLLSVMPLY